MISAENSSFEIFILIHDQDLILELEKNNSYKNLPEYKYIFLGMRPSDKLDGLKDKVIFARDLPNNIEDKKCLYDYTGHYALAKNDIVKAKNVVVVHYDVFFYPNFCKKISEAFSENENVFINFQPVSLYSYFLEDSVVHVLGEAMKQVYNIDIYQKADEYKKRGDLFWQTGGSFACSLENLRRYVDYTLPLIPIIEKDKMAAHNTERMIKFFTAENNLNEVYITDTMNHIYNSSHDQAYTSEKYKAKAAKKLEKLLKGKVDSEYLIWKIKNFIYSVQKYGKSRIVKIFGIKFKINKKIKET